MGNCLRRDSSIQWGGDDWASSPVPDRFFSTNTRSLVQHDDIEKKSRNSNSKDEEERGLLMGSSSKSNKEVKIKISKKQLMELLGRVDMNELSVEQVLAQLMNNITDGFQSDHHIQGPWKPNLQSIPE